jgi:hypothetical protein
MRKLILAVASVAALMALPALASADVPRCQDTVDTAATATFTTTTPSGAGGLWTTLFTVTVQPDGTFAGTGTTSGHDVDDDKTIAEVVTGKFTDTNNDKMADTVSFTSDRPQPLYTDTWTMTNAPMDGVTETIATVNVNWTVAVKVNAPVFTYATTTDLNHGQYVKSQGGGSVAAKKCAGMPLNSTQGK